MTLNDIMKFTVGKNVTRLKEQDEKNIYKPEDFENDLHGMTDEESFGCIINLIRSTAVPLTKEASGKCLTSNFLLCSFDTEVLDPWYFCYLINESKEVEQQISMLHQGTTLSVKKLTIKSIGELNITLLDMEKQKLIGKLYKDSIKQKDLMLKQVENISTLTKILIHKIEED